jgi:hypothetical protein
MLQCILPSSARPHRWQVRIVLLLLLLLLLQRVQVPALLHRKPQPHLPLAATLQRQQQLQPQRQVCLWQCPCLHLSQHPLRRLCGYLQTQGGWDQQQQQEQQQKPCLLWCPQLCLLLLQLQHLWQHLLCLLWCWALLQQTQKQKDRQQQQSACLLQCLWLCLLLLQ